MQVYLINPRVECFISQSIVRLFTRITTHAHALCLCSVHKVWFTNVAPRTFIFPCSGHLTLALYLLLGAPLCIPCRPHLDFRFGFAVREPVNPNPNVLSVRFGFGEALNLNRTERTVRAGSGSGSGIFLNRTDGPVQGSGKFTPEPDRTEPRHP